MSREPSSWGSRLMSYGIASLLLSAIGATIWLTWWTGDLLRGLLLLGLQLVLFGGALRFLVVEPSLGSVRWAKRLLVAAQRSSGPGRPVRVLVAWARLALVRRQRHPR
jgi:hypothetical protein